MTSRALRIGLAASLFANVFAFGAIGGGLWMLRGQDRPRPNAGAAGRPIVRAGQGLPAPDRQRFEETIRRVLMDNRDLQRTAVQSRRSAAGLFVQTQFDAAAVAGLLAQGRNADTTLQARLDTAAIDFAVGLPPEERAILAQGLQRGGPLRHPPP